MSRESFGPAARIKGTGDQQRSSQFNGQRTSNSNDSNNRPSIPSISLPKGGGAIRGLGEKFAANPVTGTGSLNVPIFTSPGRSGFGPQLSLSYDSGAGNGPFGFGWNLSLPSITRKTDKGLPRYQDDQESAEDVFILSGAEDLVPVFKKDKNGDWIRDQKGNFVLDEKEDHGYVIRPYRPRIEGLFARIERWTRRSDGDAHWRSISKDNILTVYGRDEKSRIADPDDSKGRVFSWLICESYDDKGNAIVYEYAAENDIGIDLSQANEQNRSRTANRYIKRIWYGNRQPLLLDINKPSFRKSHVEQMDFSSAGWMFEVIFDYGVQDHYIVLPLDSSRPEDEQHRFVQASSNASASSGDAVWSSSRPDPFSSYRAGFEVRTYRRCKRVLMFHRFTELGSEPYLVRSTEFDYSDFDYSQGRQPPIEVKAELEYKGSTRFASFIQSVTQSGYVLDETKPARVINGVKYLTYLKKSLPPLEFEYNPANIHENVKEVDALSLENLPSGLDGTRYQWVDLDGEGLSGILTEQSGAWFYKRNVSGLPLTGDDGKPVTAAQFAPVERLKDVPSPGNLGTSGQQLMDLSGDGQLDLVQFNGSLAGFFERTNDEKWETFAPFTSLPNIRWDDPNLKFIDLTGDGHGDILITEDHAFVWYPSLAEEGFADGTKKVRQSLNEEEGPQIVFADGAQSIYLADMSGDGLTDLVRIRNGEVCYWPNLGYGHFGAKVTMDKAPWFDIPNQFDHNRIRLADVDGSGVTDIIYLGSKGVQIYFNQSGNRWSSAQTLFHFPHIDNLSSIQVVDLLGNGTACLVWSSPLPGNSHRPMRYIDLMGGQKPHLLLSLKNNLGAETSIHYAASTKFYLADKAAGKPWITRLPFPVHVVERVETYDRISRNRFVTRYAYHHGHFDGTEREFRGFGMVEQWDTEEIGTLTSDVVTESGSDTTNWHNASFVPPVLTRTWFHTGAYFEDSSRISKQFAEEYYREGDPSLGEDKLENDELSAMLLSDTMLPSADVDRDLDAEEIRQACGALKGGILRQETYALDRRPDGRLSEESDRPYTVSERNYTIKRLQPRGRNIKHAVFFVHPRETIDFHYERKIYDIVDIDSGQTKKRADPRVMHNATLEVDDYGNIIKLIAIVYGRRYPDSDLSEQDQKKQRQTLITYTENRFTNAILQQGDHAYRTPLSSETRTFEVLKVEPPRTPIGSTAVAAVTSLYSFYELEDLAKETNFSQGRWDIPHNDIQHALATGNHPYRRLIEHVRTLYRSNRLDRLLQLGQVESLALPGETYKLAFTKGLLAAVYQRKLQNGQPPENLLPNPSDVLGSKGPDGGGYVDIDRDGKNWWIPSGRVFYCRELVNDPPRELDFASKHFFLPHRFCDPFDKNTFVAYDSETDPRNNHNILILRISDPLDNTIVAKNNYRVLQPEQITDPNDAISEVLFDALGLVVAIAIHKGAKGDSLRNIKADLTQKQIDDFFANPKAQGAVRLGSATSSIIYNLERYYTTKNPDKPPYAAMIVRETHASDLLPVNRLLKIQITFSYSDGFEREIQKKIQAESGLVNGVYANTRWVGTGWTIFNNKGKPVRQYEPFFTNSHEFKFAKTVGISSTLFYDPLGRVVSTLHPNHTYEKVVFNPWNQQAYDVNDTIILDPRTDQNIRGFVAKYFDDMQQSGTNWYTWYNLRIGGAFGNNLEQRRVEKNAAIKTAAHKNTPTTTYFDTLGRAFLTVTNNGQDSAGNSILYHSRIEFDIEGNQRAIMDVKDRIVMRYDNDMLGTQIHQQSMEAGERWILNDVMGKPIRLWKNPPRQDADPVQVFKMEYDELRRPIRSFVTGFDPANFTRRIMFERLIYGEQHPQAKIRNLLGKVYLQCDGAGIVTSEEFDFKGNLKHGTRRLAKEYRNSVDWTSVDAAVPSGGRVTVTLTQLTAAISGMTENESFSSKTMYNALNRPIQIIAPHSDKAGAKINVIQPVYNEANLLDRVDLWLEREQSAEPEELLDPSTASQHSVENINYNAKGQREYIEYGMEDGNRVWTTYEYDEKTFRLVHMQTRRKRSGHRQEELLQDLYYTYDPVGNITHIRDNAQQKLFVKGRRVEPSTDYQYDAIYRLVEAIGREHLGVGSANPPEPTSHTDNPRVSLNLNDPNFLGTYSEKYTYDSVGNIKKIDHTGTDPSNPGWTRSYNYHEDSAIEAGKKSNRLSSTMNSNGTSISSLYKHDAHGNMTMIPHFDHRNPYKPNMRWDFEDQLHRVDLDGGGTCYYVYDFTGQRMRKVHKHNGMLVEERIYIGNFDVYRKRSGRGLQLVLERESLHIMDDKQRIELIETRIHGSDDSPALLTRYQLGNHLGSTSLELDSKAQVISYEEYTPFGSTSYQAARSQTETPKRYRYTGKERDEETGLYYHGARYYTPWLGRWISCDPAELIDGHNLYIAYRNNPERYRDHTGMSPGDEFAKLGDVDEFRRQLKRGKNIAEHPIPHKLIEHLLKVDPGDTSDAAKFLRSLVGDSPINKRDYRKAWTIIIEKATADLKTFGSGDLRQINELKVAIKKGMPIDILKEITKAMDNAVEALEKGKSSVSKTDLLRTAALQLARYGGKVSFATRTAQFLAEKVKQFGKSADEYTKRYGGGSGHAGMFGGEGLDKITNDILEGTKQGIKKLAAGNTGKLVKGIGGVLLEKGGKLVPVAGTAVGAGLAAKELASGNYASAFVEAAGASEIPIVAQVADIGSLTADIGWIVKDVFDPEQKVEQWWYETFLK